MAVGFGGQLGCGRVRRRQARQRRVGVRAVVRADDRAGISTIARAGCLDVGKVRLRGWPEEGAPRRFGSVKINRWSTAGVTNHEVSVGVATALGVARGVRFLALHGVFQFDALGQPLESLRVGLRLGDGVWFCLVLVHARSIHPTSSCSADQISARRVRAPDRLTTRYVLTCAMHQLRTKAHSKG
jgi:hypothetical protein